MKYLKLFEEYHYDTKESELADWQQRWDQLMMDMEEEAEPEGGPIASEYAEQMEEMEREKEEILSRYQEEESEDDIEYRKEIKYEKEWDNLLRYYLNPKQLNNIANWYVEGRDEEFIKIRLSFFGLEDNKLDKFIEDINKIPPSWIKKYKYYRLKR